MEPSPNAIAVESATIEIDADPTTVYALVADIARMGEWSPEATGGEWIDGGSARVGDWFAGHNRAGEREWTRECEVVRADPGRDFTFVVGGLEANRTWWSYEMEPTADGTTLTERWWVVNKSPAMLEATEEQWRGRIELTRSMLSQTIAALKEVAEAPNH